MKIELDRKIYNDATVSKAIYWLSNQFSFNRNLEGDIETVNIQPKPSVLISPEEIKFLFLDTLNDYKLRGIIHEETKDIRTILYVKAFLNDECIDEVGSSE